MVKADEKVTFTSIFCRQTWVKNGNPEKWFPVGSRGWKRWIVGNSFACRHNWKACGQAGQLNVVGNSIDLLVYKWEQIDDLLDCSVWKDDRRDACRALKAMSRKFRVLVGAQALDPLIQVLERDAADEEIIGYALDTISNICSPGKANLIFFVDSRWRANLEISDEFEEELLAAKNGNRFVVNDTKFEIYTCHD